MYSSYMNTFLVVILIILVGFYLLDVIVEWLNLNQVKTTVPQEFEDVYDVKKYKQSQLYLKDKTLFGLIQQTVMLVLTLGFIFFGGFDVIDLWVRQFAFDAIVTGVCYMLTLGVLMMLIGLPFSYYFTFVIEEKYQFNKSTKQLFFVDTLKSLFLSMVIGVPVLYSILWFFEFTGEIGWLLVWGFIAIVQLVLVYIAPTLIMPLFNKFEPLAQGELKTAIESYAKKYNFGLKGVFTMDGSKRSSKSNAYFTGFGKQRRIVLFDTLISKQSVDELVVILAHEMGHFKKGHIHKTLVISMMSTGLMLYLFSMFINNADLAAAFSMTHVSLYSSLVFFGFLYQPISFVLGVFSHVLSRKHEFEADRFAVETTNNPDAMITALKKLSVDNLSNLTPHWLKVFLEYSHPPVLKRIDHIRSL